MNRGHKQTDLIIMDFTKAFDKVPLRSLSHKLDFYVLFCLFGLVLNDASTLVGHKRQTVLNLI